MEHTHPPTSQDGKTWYRDGCKEEAGRKTTKWPVVGQSHCEWAAHQPAWRSSAHDRKHQHSARSTRSNCNCGHLYWIRTSCPSSTRSSPLLVWEIFCDFCFCKIQRSEGRSPNNDIKFLTNCGWDLGPDLNKLGQIKNIGILFPIKCLGAIHSSLTCDTMRDVHVAKSLCHPWTLAVHFKCLLGPLSGGQGLLGQSPLWIKLLGLRDQHWAKRDKGGKPGCSPCSITNVLYNFEQVSSLLRTSIFWSVNFFSFFEED